MLSSELKDALLRTRLCQYLEASEIDVLIEHNKIVSFESGDVVLQQGKHAEGIYIIIDGVVLVNAKILGEGVTNLITLSHGNFVGEVSLIDCGPSLTTAIANTHVECLLITSAYFEMLQTLSPSTKYKITRAIGESVCDRIKALRNKITQVMSESDMAKRSVFSEAIKSLSAPIDIPFDQIGFETDQLKKTPIFELFSDAEFNEFLNHTHLIKATKKCNLIYEGEKEAPCFIVLRGAVQTSIVEHNKVAKLSVLGPLSVFTSITFIYNDSPAILNYTTCERAILLKITMTDLKKLEMSNQKIWYRFFEIICKAFVALELAADKLEVRLNSEIYNR